MQQTNFSIQAFVDWISLIRTFLGGK